MELKKKSIKNVTITIRLDLETLQNLKSLSEKYNLSNGEVIRQMIAKLSLIEKINSAENISLP